MKITNFIQFTIVWLCLAHGLRGDETLVDTFNDIYDSCLVHLNVDCVQPKAYEWFNKAIQKREIQLTEDLSIIKNETAAVIFEEPEAENENGGARDNQFNIIAQVDDFLATHYLNVRYPKAVINSNVPSFVVPTLNRLIPDAVQVPLEETNVNEGRGLVKKVLVPFLLGLKFKTTVLLPLAFALIALKAWKALTLGLISLVVSTAVVVFKLAKPKIVNYEVVHYPHHHHLDHHLVDHHHLDHHHLDHHHHLEHLEHVHPVPHAHIEHLGPHEIAYPAHLKK